MFALGGRDGRVVRGRATVPAVPADRPVTEDCAACGRGDRNGVLRTRQVVDGVDMALCLDYFACAERYRGRVSPASYGAALRGEILAVAP